MSYDDLILCQLWSSTLLIASKHENGQIKVSIVFKVFLDCILGLSNVQQADPDRIAWWPSGMANWHPAMLNFKGRIIKAPQAASKKLLKCTLWLIDFVTLDNLSKIYGRCFCHWEDSTHSRLGSILLSISAPVSAGQRRNFRGTEEEVWLPEARQIRAEERVLRAETVIGKLHALLCNKSMFQCFSIDNYLWERWKRDLEKKKHLMHNCLHGMPTTSVHFAMSKLMQSR